MKVGRLNVDMSCERDGEGGTDYRGGSEKYQNVHTFMDTHTHTINAYRHVKRSLKSFYR
jgi:hypothetical protein